LFLDELPEFNRKALEALRQPLEDNYICINRVKRTLVFPASFILACALNPCPCGNFFSPQKTCHCGQTKIKNYLGKISAPLLDRIDLHITVAQLKYSDLSDETQEAESSAQIRQRVEEAREKQAQRFTAAGENTPGIFYNAQMPHKLIRQHCLLDNEAQKFLRMAVEELSLSARAYDKILKVSRTISDLAGSENIRSAHLAEAIQYRSLDRDFFV
jgi:magnesium chelatase family protein